MSLCVYLSVSMKLLDLYFCLLVSVFVYLSVCLCTVGSMAARMFIFHSKFFNLDQNLPSRVIMCRKSIILIHQDK